MNRRPILVSDDDAAHRHLLEQTLTASVAAVRVTAATAEGWVLLARGEQLGLVRCDWELLGEAPRAPLAPPPQGQHYPDVSHRIHFCRLCGPLAALFWRQYSPRPAALPALFRVLSFALHASAILQSGTTPVSTLRRLDDGKRAHEHARRWCVPVGSGIDGQKVDEYAIDGTGRRGA